MRKIFTFLLSFVLLLTGCVNSTGEVVPQVTPVVNVITNNITGNVTLNSLLPSQTGFNGYRLTTNGTDTSWQPPSFAGAYTYYFQATASDVAGNYKALITTYSPKTMITYLAVTNNETIGVFITDPNFPNLLIIPAGAFEIHIHASATGGTKTTTLHGELWETTSNGTEIAKIGEGEPTSTLIATETEYRMIFVTNNVYSMNSTSSRVEVKFHTLLSGGGAAPDVNLFVGGTADSHVSFPSATIAATNFVPYTGALQNLDMGSYNITSQLLSTNITLLSNGRIKWSDNVSSPLNTTSVIAWLPVLLPDGTTAYQPVYK